AVGYRNAGTCEFLVDGDGRFYFLEVNTRLQVEHPVTECVTGVDLVHLQLQVAAGARLADLLQGIDLTPKGHAIEARIYAEDPANGYLPAAGRLTRVDEPSGPGIRVDSGVHGGAEVPVHYDPMLAKLIVWGPDRESARRRMAQALSDSAYLGIPTNVDFLRRVVEDPRFRDGDLRTDMLDMPPDLARAPDDDTPDEVLVAAVLAHALGAGAGVGGGAAPAASTAQDGAALWQQLGGFRVFGGAR
ncbi:MAG: Acetyl-/propionyl-coenzyme carboxylase alpha chain, partial [Planctomycetota bacterium]